MGHGCRWGLTKWFCVTCLMWLQSECHLGPQSSQGLTGVTSAHLTDYWQASEDPFPISLLWSLQGATSPHGSSHPQSERKHPWQKPQSFYNRISEGTWCHICYILFLRGKSASPAHTQGTGVIQGQDCQVGMVGHRLRGCLPQLWYGALSWGGPNLPSSFVIPSYV